MAVNQATAWFLLLILILTIVPICAAVYLSYGMIPPPIIDTWVLKPAVFARDYALWIVLAMTLLAAANLGWLAVLGRNRFGRVVREVWAALVLTLPALVLFAGLAILMIGWLLTYDASTWSAFGMAKDGLEESTRLSGEWRLEGVERAGEWIANENGSLGVNVESHKRSSRTEFLTHIDWQFEGEHAKGLMRFKWRSPKRIEILRKDRDNVDRIQFALYSVDSDQIRIIFSPPGTPDVELPSTFATRNTDHVLLVFRRIVDQ